MGSGSYTRLELPVWSLHVLPFSVFVLTGYSGFLQDMHVKLIRLLGHFKLKLDQGVPCRHSGLAPSSCNSLYKEVEDE